MIKSSIGLKAKVRNVSKGNSRVAQAILQEIRILRKYLI